MSFKVDATHNFEREFKWLYKKYRSLKKDLEKLISELEVNPNKGTPIGSNCYKIRFSISSKSKGKSGGARIITHVFVSGKVIYLLSIYDKSEKSTLTETEIKELLKFIEK